jgi:hypothetical protein
MPRNAAIVELDGTQVRVTNPSKVFLLATASRWSFSEVRRAALALTRDETEGLGDAPWPPNLPKAKGEPPRVRPSRRRAP